MRSEEIVDDEIFCDWLKDPYVFSIEGIKESFLDSQSFFLPTDDDDDSTQICSNPDCGFLIDDWTRRFVQKCYLCPDVEYCSIVCQVKDWQTSHSEVHRNLPAMSDYPNDFSKLGYKNRNGGYTREKANTLSRMIVEAHLYCLIKVYSTEELDALKAIKSNDPCTAVKLLTTCIDRYNFAYLKHNKEPKYMTMTYLRRTFCNWTLVKDSVKINKMHALELITDVLSDCGFLTGLALVYRCL
jgi:hypothetical protein